MKLIDNQFITIAETLASKSTMRHKLCCLAVYKNKVLAVGYNKLLSDQVPEKTIHGDIWSIHAEIDSVRKAMKVYPELKNEGITLYVARKGFKMAKPCDDCQKILKKMKVKKVFYSAGMYIRDILYPTLNDPLIGEETLN